MVLKQAVGKAHWSDNLKAHHQSKIDYHQSQLNRLSRWDRPKAKKAASMSKRLPGETKQETFQRHQKQAAGAITAAAAVPALLALRSGRRASVALASRDKQAHAIHSAAQLRHAATATAFGGLAGATGAMGVPRRVLSPNYKRHQRPKDSKYTTGIGKAAPAQRERAQHYGRMAGTNAALGVAAGTVGGGAGIVGHLESKGHDPMGFADRRQAGQRPLAPKAKLRALTPFSQAHGKQAKVLGGLSAAGLGLAGAYKIKQRRELGKALTAEQHKHVRQASDVGLGLGSAGVGGAALVQGSKNSHMLNSQANLAVNEARGAHHVLAGHKMGQLELGSEHELPHNKRIRRVGIRVATIKKPAALVAGGAAAAGGAGLYELGRHTLRSRKTGLNKGDTMIDAFGVTRADLGYDELGKAVSFGAVTHGVKDLTGGLHAGATAKPFAAATTAGAASMGAGAKLRSAPSALGRMGSAFKTGALGRPHVAANTPGAVANRAGAGATRGLSALKAHPGVAAGGALAGAGALGATKPKKNPYGIKAARDTSAEPVAKTRTSYAPPQVPDAFRRSPLDVSLRTVDGMSEIDYGPFYDPEVAIGTARPNEQIG